MARMNLNRLPAPHKEAADPTPLTGFVFDIADGQLKEASDIEERFARACKHAGIEFSFQVQFSTVVSLVGEEKIVDFVVHGGINQPVDIDGEIGHKSAAQKGRDQMREVLLNQIFAQRGMLPLIRIKWTELETQAKADAVVKRILI